MASREQSKSGDPVRRHFDAIAENYNEEIPAYIGEHLNAKWWGLVSTYFAPDAKVLDIGCGDGTNAVFLLPLRSTALAGRIGYQPGTSYAFMQGVLIGSVSSPLSRTSLLAF